MLDGRPGFCFCRLRGLDFDRRPLRLLCESVLLIGVRGLAGLEGGMSELVGELVGLEEKRVVGRRFLSSPPAGALSGGSLMGVNAEISGRKIVKDFLLRLSDISANVHSRSLYADCPNKDLQSKSEGTGEFQVEVEYGLKRKLILE